MTNQFILLIPSVVLTKCLHHIMDYKFNHHIIPCGIQGCRRWTCAAQPCTAKAWPQKPSGIR